MKNYFLPILLICFIFSGCYKIENRTPVCVKEKIKDFAKKQSCDNGVKVEEYTFQGETVYVFDPGTCGTDMAAGVIDSDCNNLGYLGGISRNTTINGEDFSNAILHNITWEK